MENDLINNSARDETVSTDLYDCLSEIEVLLQAGDSSPIRTDIFEKCLETVFNVSINEIDDIETLICDKSQEVREVYEELYNLFRDGVRTSFDRYLGVTFTYDDINRKPDLNELYSVYNTLYLNEYSTLGKIMAYIILKNPGVYDLRKDTCFTDIIEDDGVFNLDTIPEILSNVDPGNKDNLYVFGDIPEPDDDDGSYTNPEVAINFDVWKAHLTKGLNLGAGVLNKEILRNKILQYIDVIKNNKIL
jgi:hypothetical protein